jgi:hypothetical protein
MKTLTSWCIQLTACVLLAAAFATPAQAADDKKADPTGTWTWSTPGRNGGEARESTMKLKMEDGKLVGTITGGGRGGGNAPAETKLQNVKLTGDELAFDLTREFNGNSFTSKYKGKVAGDTITGKISRERDGETRETDWTAKRKKDEKKEAAK